MGTCLPAVTEALAATPGVASSAGKTWPYWQIPQSACSVTRGYGFHTVEVNHTQGSKSDRHRLFVELAPDTHTF